VCAQRDIGDPFTIAVERGEGSAAVTAFFSWVERIPSSALIASAI
jgi:hypothetical protein